MMIGWKRGSGSQQRQSKNNQTLQTDNCHHYSQAFDAQQMRTKAKRFHELKAIIKSKYLFHAKPNAQITKSASRRLIFYANLRVIKDTH